MEETFPVTKQNKPIQKDHILNVFNYMALYKIMVKRQVAVKRYYGWLDSLLGRMTTGSTEASWVQWNYWNSKNGVCHYSIGCAAPRVFLNADSRLWWYWHTGIGEFIVTNVPLQHMKLTMGKPMCGNNGEIYGNLCFSEQFVSGNLYLKQLKEPCLNVRQMVFYKHIHNRRD